MKRMLACLSLMIALFSCSSISPDSPRKTVVSFIEAAKTGDLAEIKKYISKSDASLMDIGQSFLSKLDPEGGKNMMDKMSKEFKEKTKDAKIEIKDEKIDGDNATVNVEFMNEGKTETRPFSLVKEEGLWKISLMSTGMKNSGGNQQDMEDAMRSINIDSLKGALNEGMKEFNKVDKDSLNKMMQEGMKEFNKISKDSLKKVMNEGMKELNKLKDNTKTN